MEKYIQLLISNNYATFVLEKNRKEPIKIRYEYKYKNNNEVLNLFLYFSNWATFINFYSKIPDNNKHFYEIVQDECKFFMDLDAKTNEISILKWYDSINEIKNKVKSVIYEITNKNAELIEFESLPTINENKYSCHIIVSNIRLPINQCKVLCKIITDKVEIEKGKIIDISVYNNWRSLRIEGSSKIGSKRIKRLKINNEIIINNDINIKGLITNFEKTIYINLLNNNFIDSNFYDKNVIVTDIKNPNKYNLTYIDNNFLDKSKKYNYNNNDILFIKNNYKKIEIFINSWHCRNGNIFCTNKIINNMILYKRKRPSNCNICNRIHENQHPYVFSKCGRLYFDCRRSESKPLDITYLYNN